MPRRNGVGPCKSTNGGRNWTAVIAEQFGRRFSSIAIDPRDSNAIYASAEFICAPGCSPSGVFKSTDGGETWSVMNAGLSDANVLSLAIDPGDVNAVYAGTTLRSLYVSYDGGQIFAIRPNYQRLNELIGKSRVDYGIPPVERTRA